MPPVEDPAGPGPRTNGWYWRGDRKRQHADTIEGSREATMLGSRDAGPSTALAGPSLARRPRFSRPGRRSDTLGRRIRVVGESVSLAVVAHLDRLAAVPRHGLPAAARFRAGVGAGRHRHVHRDAGGAGGRRDPACHRAERPGAHPAACSGCTRGHRARRPRPRHRDEPALHDRPGRLRGAPDGQGGSGAREGRSGSRRAAGTASSSSPPARSCRPAFDASRPSRGTATRPTWTSTSPSSTRASARSAVTSSTCEGASTARTTGSGRSAGTTSTGAGTARTWPASRPPVTTTAVWSAWRPARASGPCASSTPSATATRPPCSAAWTG